jgi:hypothetical protein
MGYGDMQASTAARQLSTHVFFYPSSSNSISIQPLLLHTAKLFCQKKKKHSKIIQIQLDLPPVHLASLALPMAAFSAAAGETRSSSHRIPIPIVISAASGDRKSSRRRGNVCPHVRCSCCGGSRGNAGGGGRQRALATATPRACSSRRKNTRERGRLLSVRRRSRGQRRRPRRGRGLTSPSEIKIGTELYLDFSQESRFCSD